MTDIVDDFAEQAGFETATYVSQMAMLLALPIPEEIRPSVVQNFERLRTIAHPVLEFELPDDIEPAPHFEP